MVVFGKCVLFEELGQVTQQRLVKDTLCSLLLEIPMLLQTSSEPYHGSLLKHMHLHPRHTKYLYTCPVRNFVTLVVAVG